MPRALCVGNGNLQVNIDDDLNIRDMFYPFVGLENHVSGHFCRFGVWVDGRFSWIDASWNKRFGYKADSLVTEVLLKKADLQLELQVEDAVHHFHDIFIRKVTVKNTAEKEREVRLFFSHDLHIADTDKGITAYYEPETDAIIHFKKDRYFSINGSSGEDGLFQFAVGVTEFGGLKGTWKDAEDGELGKNPVAHGSVDSTISLKASVPGSDEKEVYYWIGAGRTLEEISKLQRIVADKGPERLTHGAAEYHKAWVNKSACMQVTVARVDTDDWQITHPDVGLTKDPTRELGFKKPLLGSVTVCLPVTLVDALADVITLNKSLQELKNLDECKSS